MIHLAGCALGMSINQFAPSGNSANRLIGNVRAWHWSCKKMRRLV
jgi:hypothetical protein